jgi:hypothetical protein
LAWSCPMTYWIEDIPYFLGFGQVAEVEVLFASQLLLDDLIAQLDALIADVNSRTGDQLSDLILGLFRRRST